MPKKSTVKRAAAAKKSGKAPSTQAGEYVREQMDKLKEGSPRVANRKQAIAIGLSEARKEGVKVPNPPKISASAKKSSTKKAASKKSAAGKKATKKS
jgi:predicted transcriptional regulator